MPGGMVTTMRRQLDEMRRPELFDAALEECGRVRAEFGWPIMVTPFSQFVGTQAVMNVMDRERYTTIPDDVIVYFLGHFGTPPAPPDPEVADRVLSLPLAEELRALEPLSLDGARERFGTRISDEELLLRLTMPAEQVDAMVAGSRGERPRPPRPAATRSSGCSTRSRGRPSIGYLRLEKDDTLRRVPPFAAGGDPMRLDDVRGFVFDVDGTLVRRFPDGVHPLPGAVAVLEAIRASGRPLAIFSNGSHMPPEQFARELRADGLPVADEEMVTPVRSALSYLRRRHAGAPVLLFAAAVGARAAASGRRDRRAATSDGRPGRARPRTSTTTTIADLEEAARAVVGGARLLTANYLPAYAGANGPIFSRGAMVTAAIAKAADVRPTVVGKPSRAAVQELRERLGVPTEDLLVTGDDVRMDVGLGLLGGSRTVLVRSGISGPDRPGARTRAPPPARRGRRRGLVA